MCKYPSEFLINVLVLLLFSFIQIPTLQLSYSIIFWSWHGGTYYLQANIFFECSYKHYIKCKCKNQPYWVFLRSKWNQKNVEVSEICEQAIIMKWFFQYLWFSYGEKHNDKYIQFRTVHKSKEKTTKAAWRDP